MVFVVAEKLSKIFDHKQKKTPAFCDLDFAVLQGEFFAIVGPSGCGKSTLLRTIAGLEKPTSGRLEMGMQASGLADPSIGMVFQEHALFPWMSLKRNITILLENSPQILRQHIDSICEAFLGKVGLLQFQDYYPHQVSGGMRQRVSIARSFAINPDLLLMDEPFVFLDYQTRQTLQHLLLSCWRESKKTILFVTHDIEEAVLLADRILVLTSHPGRVSTVIDVQLMQTDDLFEKRKDPLFLPLVEQLSQLIRYNE